MQIKRRSTRVVALAAAALSMLAVVTGCSRADRSADSAEATDQGPASELRLGYFPNVTHASALIGLDRNLFAQRLGETKLVPTKFNAGPEEVNALLGGSLDAGFIGSGPAISAYAQSEGSAVRLIAGGTSGGAQLVVKPEINTPQDLQGKTVATPQLANTQDVALKKWLSDQSLTGVNVQNIDNALTLDQFRQGAIQGAWLPEPWASRLVLEAGAKVLVDEKDLWPGGQFPTTVLVVRTQFLKEHPATVTALLQGLLDANGLAESDPEAARTAVNNQLQQLTGKALAGPVLERAWQGIQLTADPLAGTFPQLSQDQVTAGVKDEAPEVAGFADLSLLNEVLTQSGKTPVDAAGLDTK